MLKKIKRSIDEMPRPAYIFLKNVLMLCCIMLSASLLLFAGDNGIESYERIKLAYLMLESPAGLLLLSLVGLAFILDRC